MTNIEKYLVLNLVLLLGLFGVLAIDNIKLASRINNVSRQNEALRRTTGHVDNAYVCFSGSTKKQLERLLDQ